MNDKGQISRHLRLFTLLAPATFIGALDTSAQSVHTCSSVSGTYRLSPIAGGATGTYDGCLGLSGPQELEAFGAGFRADGTAGRARGFTSVSMNGSSGRSLGLQVFAEGEFGWLYTPRAEVTATISYNDRIGLVWGGLGTTPPLPGTDLRFKYGVSGSFAVEIDGAVMHGSRVYAEAGATVRFGAQSHSGRRTINRVFGTDFTDLSPSIDFTTTVNEFGQADLSVSFSASARATWGRAAARFGNTLTLERIEFLDGTTPEEHGWDIMFDSGMRSPNVIPEPTSLSLMISLTSLLAATPRRKR